jgi:hypothetical protein
MCDYSLECVASRPAKVGDRLVSTDFPGTYTRGFAAIGEPGVAVCLLPGTELAFDEDVEQEARLTFMPAHKLGSTVARFRHVDEDQPHRHHDALEFSNGTKVLLTHLRKGQTATVLQLPVEATTPEPAAPAVEQPQAEARPTLAEALFGR